MNSQFRGFKTSNGGPARPGLRFENVFLWKKPGNEQESKNPKPTATQPAIRPWPWRNGI